MKKIYVFSFSIIGTLIMTACVSDGTYLGGHVVVNTNRNTKDSAQFSSVTTQLGNDEERFGNIPYKEGKVSFKSLMDVDTAYTKIKREFGFYTREERIRATPSLFNNEAFLNNAQEFSYEALPGVSYHMKERTNHSYNGQDRVHNIETFIEKDRSHAEIIFRFWIKDPAINNLNEYGKSIQVRAEKALGQKTSIRKP